MKKFLITIVVGIALLVAAFTGVMLFTAVPLKIGATFLDKLGVRVTGLSGNLTSGFRFASITFLDEFTDFKIQDVNFEYSGLWESVVHKNVVYDAVEIGSAELNIKKHRPSTSATTTGTTSPSATPNSSQNPKQSWEEVKTKWREGKVIQRFAINRLRFTNIKITAPELPFPIELSEYKITNFSVVPDRVAIEELKIVSTFFDLSLLGAELDGKGIRLPKPLRAVVKTAAWKGLKKDVTLSISGSFDFTTKEAKAELALLDDHLKAHLTPGFNLAIEANDLNLSEYLTNTSAISHLNLKSEPANAMMAAFGGAVFQGDFMIGANRFVIPTEPSPNPGANAGALFRGVFADGPLRYEAYFKPSLSFKETAPKPWVELRTNQKIDILDLVAQLYFKKTFMQMSDAEKTTFSEVMPTYGMGAPLTPIYVPVAPKPPTPARRAVRR